MTTQSIEFALAMVFLALGLLCLLTRFILDHTRLGRIIQEYEEELNFPHPIFSCPSLAETILGLGIVSLAASSGLTVAAVVAYGGA